MNVERVFIFLLDLYKLKNRHEIIKVAKVLNIQAYISQVFFGLKYILQKSLLLNSF